jgi:hypothetical protein
MKTLILLILIALAANVTAQISTTFHLGYSTQSTNQKPVTGFKVAYAFTFYKNANKKAIRKINPLIELGEQGHSDENADHIIYGHINAGVIYKQNISLTAGFIYGGNQIKQDRHVLTYTTIYLRYGNTSDHFTGLQLSLNGMIDLINNKKGKPTLQLFSQAAYVHKNSQYTKNLFFGSIGFRIIYQKKVKPQ